MPQQPRWSDPLSLGVKGSQVQILSSRQCIRAGQGSDMASDLRGWVDSDPTWDVSPCQSVSHSGESHSKRGTNRLTRTDTGSHSLLHRFSELLRARRARVRALNAQLAAAHGYGRLDLLDAGVA